MARPGKSNKVLAKIVNSNLVTAIIRRKSTRNYQINFNFIGHIIQLSKNPDIENRSIIADIFSSA